MKALNFVYFHVHDLGRHLPVYGVPVEAPALTAFADEALTFERAFCSSPACTPSRACALSGRHAHSTGCLGLSHMGWPLDLNETTLVDDLNAAGYLTALVGVNHERHPRTDRYTEDMTHSWDDWSTQRAVDKALNFLRDRDRERPFFLNIGSQQPHASTWKQFADNPVAADTVWLPIWMPDTAKTRADQAVFQSAIRYMDLHFGRFIAGLKAMGLDEDTIVVFTTDHGISGPRSKGFLYDRGTEITLMVRLPDGCNGGQRRKPLIANIDFRPTWLDLLGIEQPKQIQGLSFAAAFDDPHWVGQSAIFSERNFHGEKPDPKAMEYTDLFDPLRAIRTHDFHYIRNFQADLRPAEPLPICGAQQYPRPERELYDLRHDSQALINVASRPEYAAICDDLEGRLLDWMQRTGDFLPDGPIPQRPEAPGWGPFWPAN